MRRWILSLSKGALAVLPLSLLALSCVTPPLESPPTEVRPEVRKIVPQNIRNKVDVLFLVDNSNSMDAMSLELRNKFPQFFKVFRDLADKEKYSDLHIAVVTSDFGAGNVPGVPGCQVSPGGDRGRMIQLGKSAAADCKGPVGKNYIEYNFANGGAQHNLPSGQNLEKTFTCMASVGTNGCGFEHILESAYASLHDPIPENQGFLRDDALLAVVFLANEDDCSAPPQTDMFDNNRSKVGQLGYLDSYRCTRFGVVCGNGDAPPYGDSGGALANCRPAPNPTGNGPGRLYDVNRYIDFFTRPKSEGGVKINPSDVILVGIDAPAEPVQVLLSNPGTPGGSPYVPCGQLNEASTPACVPVLQHSCVNPSNADFFGDPAVRINTVVAANKLNRISSICDADYTSALTDLGNLIVSTLAGGCLEAKLTDPPDCVVEDVTTNADGSQTVIELPHCDSGQKPCWKIEEKEACENISPQKLGVTVDRGGASAPANTDAVVSCTTCPPSGC